MNQPAETARPSRDEVLVSLIALGEDPKASRVDAVHARVDVASLEAGERADAVRALVDAMRAQIDASSNTMFISVRQVRDTLTNPEDAGLEGGYVVSLNAQAMLEPVSRHASIAMDIFHGEWGFSCLNDFEIQVFNSERHVALPDPAHAVNTCPLHGEVEKFCDAPLSEHACLTNSFADVGKDAIESPTPDI
ncbi:hypothetical protein R70006_05045 [Paraburkholderia domus]|uniref:hypothetical protein n=1 Tax=Paraburkholderia domus TaxID=2793075 RepID=UPI00191370E2|nr:hypothetical protein [Paraburkholderia domus]MBK5051719.1 hypothetical protein [Burkholderia sp. R-70006]CAE6795324.1 hypothetical protein R70006_05045 [Paraburkholderia domus]